MIKQLLPVLVLTLLASRAQAQTLDTTTRNTGIPNFGRTIMLADSVARKRIADSGVVNLTGAQTITSIKTFSGQRTSSTGQVFIGSQSRAGLLSFYNYTGHAFGSIGYESGTTDTAFAIGSSGPSGNIAFYTAGVRRGSVLSNGVFSWDSLMRVKQLLVTGAGANNISGPTYATNTWSFATDIQVAQQVFAANLRSNAWTYRVNTSGMHILKPTEVSTVPYLLRIYTQVPVNTNSSMKAATTFEDSIVMTANANAAGYTVMNVQPWLKQTGYSGTLRGLYVNPTLVDVTNFRAIETNVALANGYQFYAAGAAPSYFNGSVGIGTSVTGNYKLAVEGTIGARRVKVHTTAWADYVFDSTYQLAPLQKVEQYIQENKHLPEVPDAVTVAKEGIDIGANQVLLLKKIEELTLYIIEQNKKIEKQGAQLQRQGEEIRQLKAKLK